MIQTRYIKINFFLRVLTFNFFRNSYSFDYMYKYGLLILPFLLRPDVIELKLANVSNF